MVIEMKNKEKPKKEKKIVFSPEVDQKINGFALVLAFIGIGVFLLFDNAYFGNEVVSNIVRWSFIIFGILGLSVVIPKTRRGEIKGVANFVLGIVFIGTWIILYLFLASWIINTLAFFLLVFGCFGFFKGLFEIIYSIRLVKLTKGNKSGALADILMLVTLILGLLLVIVQILQQVNIIPR